MRINVYAEEQTDIVEIISKEIDGTKFTGLRFYLQLPVTVGGAGQHRSDEGPNVFPPVNGETAQVAGPFIHRPGDDDSSAITFWGKRDLRDVLIKALVMLNDHYKIDQTHIVYTSVSLGGPQTPYADSERIDWLEADLGHLEDVRGRCNNFIETPTVREAIDWLRKNAP